MAPPRRLKLPCCWAFPPAFYYWNPRAVRENHSYRWSSDLYMCAIVWEYTRTPNKFEKNKCNFKNKKVLVTIFNAIFYISYH